MKANGSMEIISFEPVETSTSAEFLDGLRILDTFFKSGDGYNSMHAALEEDGRWTVVFLWESAEAEKKATAKMFSSEETKAFLALVKPQSVSKNVWPYFS